MKGVYLRISPWTVVPIAQTIMSEEMRREGYKINKNPYLTIVSRINSDAEYELPKFEPIQRVSVKSIRMKPNIENPVEIVLDVSEDMVVQIWRDELINQISNDKLIGDVDDLEIKLLEIPNDKDPMDINISRDVRNNIVEKVSEFEPPENIISTHLSREKPEYMKTK